MNIEQFLTRALTLGISCHSDLVKAVSFLRYFGKRTVRSFANKYESIERNNTYPTLYKMHISVENGVKIPKQK